MSQHPLQPLFENHDFFLASQSPRRKELLTQLGIPFQSVENHFDEPDQLDCPPSQMAEQMAVLKMDQFGSQLTERSFYITSDTVVVLHSEQGDKALGKAKNADHALEMLMEQSGQTQSVYSGVCLLTKTKKHEFTGKTTLRFKAYSKQEAQYYIDTCQPFDKAGAYGIQDWIGMALLAEMQGSFYNVMGLPTEQLYQSLVDWSK